MSGTVSVSAGAQWSAGWWLFDWVLTDIAKNTRDVELAGHLTGIIGEHLGWFGLNDLAAGQRREVRRIITERLVDDAQQEFPANLPGRPQALTLLKDLAVLVSSHADKRA